MSKSTVLVSHPNNHHSKCHGPDCTLSHSGPEKAHRHLDHNLGCKRQNSFHNAWFLA